MSPRPRASLRKDARVDRPTENRERADRDYRGTIRRPHMKMGQAVLAAEDLKLPTPIAMQCSH